MRVVFCGSGEFALPSLHACCQSGHEILAVITQPARRAGRGGTLRPTPVALAGGELDLPVIECADINAADMVARLKEMRADAMIVVDFGQMIRLDARQSARLDVFNLHASLLPELRGAAPVNWAIMRGYRTTGVTTFSLVDKMDAGDIYLQLSTDIDPHETAQELKTRLAKLGSHAVVKTLEMLGADPPTVRVPQNHSKATRARALQKSDGIIDWSLSACDICRQIHGTWPWPGAKATLLHKDRRIDVTLARCDVPEGVCDGSEGELGENLSVCTGSGRLMILELKPAGKRLMKWKDFVNGYRITPGDAFVTLSNVKNAEGC